MSELRPTSPIRRPETARPRGGDEVEQEPLNEAERAAIETHLVLLSGNEGALIKPQPQLGAMLVTGAGRGPAHNYAARIRWSEETWTAQLEQASAALEETGAWPSIVVADGLTEPRGLQAELERRGWSEVAQETIMWTRLPATVPHLDPSLRVEAVTAKTAGLFEELEREIFGLSDADAEIRTESLTTALTSSPLRAYLLRLHGRPIATTRLSSYQRVAALYGVGVVADHRRQGFGRLLTTIVMRAGLAMGNRLVWLSVERDNIGARRLYEQLRFSPAFTWHRLIGPPPNR